MANRDGCMFEAPPSLVLVGFCTVGERVKLIVTLIGQEGEERNEVAAMSVLREFRNVGEFIPEGDSEFPHLYLAELAPAACTRGRRRAGRSRRRTEAPC
jgi:hypothetical protein